MTKVPNAEDLNQKPKDLQLIAGCFLFANPALGIAAEILFVLYKKIEAESPPILLQELERPNK